MVVHKENKMQGYTFDDFDTQIQCEELMDDGCESLFNSFPNLFTNTQELMSELEIEEDTLP